MTARISTRKLKIEFGNCDPAQIVYYPNYVVWLDQSTHQLFEAAGVPLRDLQSRSNLQVPLVDLDVKFLAPAGWGDEIQIESCISRWGSKSFDVMHRITDVSTGTVIAEAKETRVCVEINPSQPKKLTGKVIPNEVKVAFGVS